MTYTATIRLAQTDAAGVLYGPELPRLLHDAYEAFLEAAGKPISHWLAHPRIALPLVRLTCDFQAPLRAGDRVDVSVRVAEVAARRFRVTYVVRHGSTVAAQGCSMHVAVDKRTGRATALPADLVRALKPRRT